MSSFEGCCSQCSDRQCGTSSQWCKVVRLYSHWWCVFQLHSHLMIIEMSMQSNIYQSTILTILLVVVFARGLRPDFSPFFTYFMPWSNICISIIPFLCMPALHCACAVYCWTIKHEGTPEVNGWLIMEEEFIQEAVDNWWLHGANDMLSTTILWRISDLTVLLSYGLCTYMAMLHRT